MPPTKTQKAAAARAWASKSQREMVDILEFSSNLAIQLLVHGAMHHIELLAGFRALFLIETSILAKEIKNLTSFFFHREFCLYKSGGFKTHRFVT